MDLLANTVPPEKQEKLTRAAADTFLEMKSMTFNQRLSFLLSKNLAAMNTKCAEQGPSFAGFHKSLENLASQRTEEVFGERGADIFSYQLRNIPIDPNLVETLRMFRIADIPQEIRPLLHEEVALQLGTDVKAFHWQHLTQHVSPLPLICSQKLIDVLASYNPDACASSICETLLNWTGDALSFKHLLMLLFSKFGYFCDEEEPTGEDWGSFKPDQKQQSIFCNQTPRRRCVGECEVQNAIRSMIHDTLILLLCHGTHEIVSAVASVLGLLRNLLVSRLTVQGFLLDVVSSALLGLKALSNAGKLGGADFEARYAAIHTEQGLGHAVFLLSQISIPGRFQAAEEVRADLKQKISSFLAITAQTPSVTLDVSLLQAAVSACADADEQSYCFYLYQLAEALTGGLPFLSEFLRELLLSENQLADLILCLIRLPESQERNRILTAFLSFPEILKPETLDAIGRVVQVGEETAKVLYGLYEKDDDLSRVVQFDDTLCVALQPRALELYVQRQDRFQWFTEMFQNNLNATVFYDLSDSFVREIIRHDAVPARFKVKVGIMRPEFLGAIFGARESLEQTIDLFYEELYQLYSSIEREQLQLLSGYFEPIAAQLILNVKTPASVSAAMKILQLLAMNGVHFSQMIKLLYLAHRAPDTNFNFSQFTMPLIENAALFCRSGWNELNQYLVLQQRDVKQQMKKVQEDHGVYVGFLIQSIRDLPADAFAACSSFISTLGEMLPSLTETGQMFLQYLAITSPSPLHQQLTLQYLVEQLAAFRATPEMLALNSKLDYLSQTLSGHELPAESLKKLISQRLADAREDKITQLLYLILLIVALASDSFNPSALLRAAVCKIPQARVELTLLNLHLLHLIFSNPCSWDVAGYLDSANELGETFAVFCLAYCTEDAKQAQAEKFYSQCDSGRPFAFEILCAGLRRHKRDSATYKRLAQKIADVFYQTMSEQSAKPFQDMQGLVETIIPRNMDAKARESWQIDAQGVDNPFLPLIFQNDAQRKGMAVLRSSGANKAASQPLNQSIHYSRQVVRSLLDPIQIESVIPLVLEKMQDCSGCLSVLKALNILLLHLSLCGSKLDFKMYQTVLTSHASTQLQQMQHAAFVQETENSCFGFSITRRSVFLEKIMNVSNQRLFLSNLVLLFQLIHLRYQELFQMVMEVLPPKAQLMSNQKLTNQKIDLAPEEMDLIALVMVGMLLHFKLSDQVEKDVSAVLIQKLAAIIIPPPEYSEFLPQHLLMRLLSINKLPLVKQFLEATNTVKQLQAEYEEFLDGIYIGSEPYVPLSVCLDVKCERPGSVQEPLSIAGLAKQFRVLRTQFAVTEMILHPETKLQLEVFLPALVNKEQARLFARSGQLYIIGEQIQVFALDQIVAQRQTAQGEWQLEMPNGVTLSFAADDADALRRILEPKPADK